MTVIKRLTRITLASFLLATANGAGAALVNGGFTPFFGWEGLTNEDPLGPEVPGANPDNFQASNGAVTLLTNFADNGIFLVDLSQQFEVPSINPGQFVVLDFELGYDLSDPASDLVFADLIDETDLNPGESLLPSIDLSGGGPVDVTEYVGRTARLGFGLVDADGAVDTLTVSDVSLTVVPVPAALPLLLSALGLLGFVARRRA